MAAQPSYRLDQRSGWRIAASEGIAWRAGSAMLAQRPGTIQPIDDPSGSLGGRAWPRQLTVGPGGQIYLVTTDGRLLWYDPCRELFEAVPCGSSGRLGFAEPFALSVHCERELLVLDRQSRMVTALSLADWRINRQWGPFAVEDGRLRTVPRREEIDPLTGAPTGSLVLPSDAWNPADIAALPDGRIALSERETGSIAYFDRRGCLLAMSDGASSDQSALRGPDALAVGAEGDLYVLETEGPAIARLDQSGRIVARSEDGANFPELIEPGESGDAAIAVGADGTIYVSTRLRGASRAMCCEPSGRIAALACSSLVPSECRVLGFDREGQAILGSAREPCIQRSTRVARVESGSIAFEPLDGGRSGTQWDRARLALVLREGTSARLFAHASDAPLDALGIAALPQSSWSSIPLSVRDGRAVAAILAAPGRYLWLRLEFAGDGLATPELASLSVTYPRRSSARHLPAAWSSDPPSADFLARFMLLFDEVRADTLEPLEALPALFDPKATPALPAGAAGADFLDWLAAWIGLALDRNWSVERRRRLVAEAPSLFRIKGTVEGLKRHVQVYTGIVPGIVEHYRLRRWLTLDESVLDGSGQLWGREIIRRLELDGYAEIGRFALVDGGDPLTDPVAAFAHRATVYVPVGTEFSDTDMAALEAVVEAARPAHVAVDVRVMRPQFVIGCETLLGINTILSSATEAAVADHSILGEDIRLAGPPHALSLARGTRLGRDTTL